MRHRSECDQARQHEGDHNRQPNAEPAADHLQDVDRDGVELRYAMGGEPSLGNRPKAGIRFCAHLGHSPAFSISIADIDLGRDKVVEFTRGCLQPPLQRSGITGAYPLAVVGSSRDQGKLIH